jgi:hypothetical protein
MWKAVSFARVTRDTGANDIFPCRLSSAVAGHHVIKVEFRSIKDHSAVLTGVFVPLEDVVSRELDLFFRKSFKEAEHDDTWNSDAKLDRLKHPGFGIHGRKIPPTRKIMCHVSSWSICCHDLSMALIEESERPTGRASVDGLPQSVEYQDRLIEQSVHDLVV